VGVGGAVRRAGSPGPDLPFFHVVKHLVLTFLMGGWQQATDLRPRGWGEPREGCGEARAPIRHT
jgi:hypothetical protein